MLVAFSVVPLAGCGGDSSKSAATPASTAASASPIAASASLTPTADEIAWMRQICGLETTLADKDGKIPLANQNPGSLTFADRRTRAETIWPAKLALEEEYVANAGRIIPPARAAKLHQTFTGIHAASAAEMRRSIAEIDQIFRSTEALDANNARLSTSFVATVAANDAEFNAVPALRALYLALPECKVTQGTPTP